MLKTSSERRAAAVPEPAIAAGGPLVGDGFYRSLIDASPDAILAVDLDYKIILCNRQAASWHGFEDPVELVGRNALEVLLPGTVATAMHARELLRSGAASTIECDIEKADGSVFPAEISVSPIPGPNGRPIAFRLMVRDISERKEVQSALLTSEQRYRQLFERNLVGLYRTDGMGRILDCNDALAHLLGFEGHTDLLGQLATEFYMEAQDRQEVLSELKERSGVANKEIRLRRKDGTPIWVLESASRLEWDGHGSVMYEGTLIDITARKQAEIALSQSERKHRALMEQASDGIVIFDLRGKFAEVNSQACLSVGYTPEEFMRLNVRDILSPDDAAMLGARFSQIYSRKVILFESALRHKDGHYFPCEITCKMLSDRRIQAICRDITERKRAEEALRASERRYRQLFEHNLAGVYRTTFDGTILDCNDAMLNMLGCASRDELLGRPSSHYYANPSERDIILEKLLEHGSLTNLEVCYLRADGSRMWVLENIGLVEGDETRPNMLEGTIIDITERKLLEEQLTHQAFHDALTRLPNRALFMDRLEHALARAARSGESVAVLFLDLDNFKVVNDSLGHKVGDQLLVSVGQRLLQCVRTADTVARLGGDEFTLLVEDVQSVDDGIRVAQRIADVLSTPFILEEREIYLNTSVGIAISQSPLQEPGGERPDDLLRNADLAMYQAKNSGKARYAVYEPALNRRVWERLQSEMDLRRAIEANELVLHYQPVVQLKSGETVEVEALVRWQHPTRGLVPPSEFIPLAEESGLILPLGHWVLREACRQVRTWQQELPGAADLAVSVNLSPRQFRHPRLVEDIKQGLDETGLAPCHLKLEITESAGLDNTQSTVTTLAELKEAGIQIAIDDFGTGYSALSYLKHYPIDSLKLDRSFVSGLGSNLEDTAIIHAVLAFARTLNLKVIAEGIETAEQITQLRELGCKWGQGYYFAKPMPAEAMSRLLADGTSGKDGQVTIGSKLVTGRLL